MTRPAHAMRTDVSPDLALLAQTELRARQGRWVVEIEDVAGEVIASEGMRWRRAAYKVADRFRSPLYDVVIYRRGVEVERYRHTPADRLGRALLREIR